MKFSGRGREKSLRYDGITKTEKKYKKKITHHHRSRNRRRPHLPAI